MRKHSRLTAAILGVVAVGAAVPVMATHVDASAPARVAACLAYPNEPGPAPDLIRISPRANLDFGDGVLEDNVPSHCGTLTWDVSENYTITPRLTGRLFAKNAIETTARMLMRYRDVDGTELSVVRGAAKHVGPTNDEVSFAIDLGSYSSPNIYTVDIELQQLIEGSWVTQGSASAHIGSADKAPDEVRLTARGQDFGYRPFVDGAPSGSGTLSWDLSNDTRQPHLTGDLFLQNSAGTPTSLRMTYFDVWGNSGTSVTTPAVIADRNGIVRFNIDQPGPANPYLHSVEITLEVGDGTIVAGPILVAI